MKVGLLGGTFDPIHFGHLNLAIQLKEIEALDEIWIIPALLNPFKEGLHAPFNAPFEDRAAMAALAVSEIPDFKVVDLESKRPPPSYTIDTISYLKQHYPKERFYLLLGEDAASGFFDWKDPEKIIELVHPLIGSRTGIWQKKAQELNKNITSAIEKGVRKTPLLDISSTDLRDRLHNRLYCGHLVPAKVLDYIYKNQLYYKN